MIEARYEHLQPDTGILLGHVEVHKVSNRVRGGGYTTIYLVNHESRTSPSEKVKYISEQFEVRTDALSRFNELLIEFNSRLCA